MATSILEEFIISFVTDADDVVDELDNVSGAMNETERAAQETTQEVDRQAQSISFLGGKLLALAGSFFALNGIMGAFRQEVDDVDALGKFSQLIDFNIESLGAYEQLVIRAGGTAQDFRSTISSLNDKLVELRIKGTSDLLPFFQRLGINAFDSKGRVKEIADLLPELADKFKGLDNQVSLGIGKRLGLDNATIVLLQQGGEELERLLERQKKLGVASKEVATLSAKYVDSLADLRQVGSFLNQSLLVGLLPTLTKLTDFFVDKAMSAQPFFKALGQGFKILGDFVEQRGDVIQGFFIALFAYLLPATYRWAAATTAAILPYVLIGAAIAAVGTAFALIYEDVQAFINGQNSLIGKMSKEYPIIGDIVNNLVSFIKNLISAFQGMADLIVNIFTAPQEALKTLTSIGGFLVDTFTNLFEDEEKKIDIVSRINKQKASDKSNDTGFFETIKKRFDNDANDDIEELSTKIMQVDNTELNRLNDAIPENNNQTIRKTATFQTGDIIVNTRSDRPQEIANSVNNKLNQQLQSVVDEFDDGIEA